MEESDYFHPGELEVQERAGVRRQAEELGESILPFIPSSASAFLARQRLAVIASVAADGSVWASALIEDSGFLGAPAPHTLRIAAPR